jgi:hypothetical protein
MFMKKTSQEYRRGDGPTRLRYSLHGQYGKDFRAKREHNVHIVRLVGISPRHRVGVLVFDSVAPPMS